MIFLLFDVKSENEPILNRFKTRKWTFEFPANLKIVELSQDWNKLNGLESHFSLVQFVRYEGYELYEVYEFRIFECLPDNSLSPISEDRSWSDLAKKWTDLWRGKWPSYQDFSRNPRERQRTGYWQRVYRVAQVNHQILGIPTKVPYRAVRKHTINTGAKITKYMDYHNHRRRLSGLDHGIPGESQFLGRTGGMKASFVHTWSQTIPFLKIGGVL